MTADETVLSLSQRWRFSIAEDSSLWGDVRAALRERDARWRDAVLDDASARGDPLIRTADYLRLRGPLRALLEEAGK